MSYHQERPGSRTQCDCEPPHPPAQRSGAPAPRGHLHAHHLRAWKSSLCTWGPGPSGVFPACAPTLLTGHVTSATQPPGLCTRPCPAGSVPQSEVCGVPAAPTEGKRQKDSFRHFSLKIPNPAHVATGSPIRGEWSQLEEETARPLRLGLQGTPPPPGADWPPARSSVAPQEEDLPRALPAPPPSRKRWSLPPLGGRAPPGGALHFLPKRPSCLCVPLALAPAPPGRESSRQGPPRRLRSCGFCHAPPEEGGSSEKGWDSVCPPQGPARGGSGDSGGGGDPSGAAGGTSRGL